MPWEVREHNGKWCVFKEGEDSPISGGCHETKKEAMAQLRALYANEKRMHSVLTFSQLEPSDEDNTYWVQAFRFGKWEHPTYGTIEIDETIAKQFVENFKSNVYDIELPYYYEHGLDPAKGMKRAGLIVDMEIREDGIYDKVKFTDNALTEIKAGEWRYVSPEYVAEWRDPETGNVFTNVRVGGSLTNDAFFKGMAPLNFSEIFATPEELPQKGEKVNDLVYKFAERLGIELSEDATEDEILAAADEVRNILEPLKKAKEDGEKVRSFREQYPEEYAELQRLREAQIIRDAQAFSENYYRFTVRDGDRVRKSNFGFSQRVMDAIADLHKKFSERNATHADLKNLLDLISDNGIVDYSEHGSARQSEEMAEKDPILAFSSKISELMEKDDLTYEKAFNLARSQYPQLYEEYKRSVPVIR